MSETKTFTKKTELVFTTIEIEKRYTFFGSELHEASFKYGYSKDNLQPYKTTATRLEKLIENVSKFLDCEIDERHYIIK